MKGKTNTEKTDNQTPANLSTFYDKDIIRKLN